MTPRLRGGTSERTAQVGVIASCLFLFLLPITHTTPLRLVCLGLSAVAALLVLVERTQVPPLPQGVLVAIVAWVAVCLAATLGSTDPSYSWGELRNEVVAPMLAFGAFHVLAGRRSSVGAWHLALFASFVAACTIAIVSYRWTGDWLRSSFVGDRNAYSTWVTLMVPFLLFAWSSSASQRGRRLAIGLALAGAMVSVAFTQNRNVWFAVLVECIVWAAVVYVRAAPDLRRRMRSTYLVVGTAGIVLFGAALTHVIVDKARVSQLSAESQFRFDRDPRFAIWRYAGAAIAERPWTGYGYGRGILRKDFREHFDDKLKWHGHNVLVNYVLEAGVAGGLVLIGLCFALVRQGWLYARSPDPLVARHGTWMLAMLSGIVLKMGTDDILIRENALLFWSVLGIATGCCQRQVSAVARVRPADGLVSA